MLATDVHSHPVVCETLYSVCVWVGGGEGEREGGGERGRGRERERGREEASLDCTLCIHITNDLFTCVG